ncbi:hypothetical protein [Knoellia subterranea]|uniref:hypothetical protein n=1 Tax=Knoellia subterranea TaxID=184882 RepID=UPI000A81DFA2|nr:hypothetical protein [Knoellia subterranea]
MTKGADFLAAVTVSAGDFGEVAAATTLATALNDQLGKGERSLDAGGKVVRRTANGLTSNARVYTDTDDNARDTIVGPQQAVGALLMVALSDCYW